MKIIYSFLLLSFITCIQGQTFKFSKNHGGSKVDFGYAVHVSAQHHVYTLGTYASDTVHTMGCPSFTDNIPSGGNVAVITKSDTLGNCLLTVNLSALPGPTCSMGIMDLSTDLNDNIFLLASVHGSIDVDPGLAVVSVTSALNKNNFLLAKYSPAGALLWHYVITFNGSTNYWCTINCDYNNDVVISGCFSGSADFDPSSSTKILNAGASSWFVAKYNNLGALLWADQFLPSVHSIDIDQANNIYMTGQINDTLDIKLTGSTPDMLNATPGSIFVAKYNPNGNKIWAQSLINRKSSAYGTFGEKIRVDGSGNVLVAGNFRDSIDFDAGPAKFVLGSKGMSDIFFYKCTSAGNFIFGKSIGGTLDEFLKGFDVGSKNSAYWSVMALSTTFDIDFTGGVTNWNKASGFDDLIMRTDSNGAPLSHFEVKTVAADEYFFDLDESLDAIYLVGKSVKGDNIDFDPSPTASFTPSSFGSVDTALTKYKFPAITTTVVTSVGQLTDAEDLLIFPNPVTDMLTVRSEKQVIEITIYDVQGKMLCTVSNSHKLSINYLPPAVYVVKVILENEVVIKKLVVE